MPKMISQTKDAIDKLVACGLKRADFSCRTPFDRKRLAWRDRPYIVVYRNGEVVERNVDQFLAQGFNVQLYRRDGRLSWAAVQVALYGSSPKSEIVDLEGSCHA